MSGGAWMLACRNGTEGAANKANSCGPIRFMGAARAGQTARQALKHSVTSIPWSQQPFDAGAGMFMLSHGMSADRANALMAGPKASQSVRTAARMERPIE